MSPDAQHLERFFKPGSGAQPPIDAARYQEELKDFTSFFEKLSSLDSMDWFASDESAPAPRPALAGAAAAEAAQEAREDREPPADITAEAAGAGAQTEPVTMQTPIPDGMKMLEQVLESEAEAASERATRLTPPRGPRMQVFHSAQAIEPDLQAGLVGFDARSILSDGRHGSRMRGFLGRVQLVLLIAFGASLLFAMGLGMGALVLSLPRGSAFGDHQSLVAEEVTDPSAQDAKTTESTQERIGEVSLPAYPAGENAKQAAPAKQTATPAQAASAAAPQHNAAHATAATARAHASASSTASAPSPEPAAPAAAQPSAQAAAEGSFALQVGACSAYPCVEQFRNLLLAEVESSRIKVISAGEGTQAIHRIRVEPLTRESAEQLKETLAAKDARLAKAYLVSLR